MASAVVLYVGGAQDGSRLVVGPEAECGDAIIPIIHALRGIQEVLGVGTLFPDEAGKPVLHMHAAAGREGQATVGCTRAGVEVWLVGEVVLLQILGAAGERKKSPAERLQASRSDQYPHLPIPARRKLRVEAMPGGAEAATRRGQRAMRYGGAGNEKSADKRSSQRLRR